MDIWVKIVSFQIIQNVLNVKTTLAFAKLVAVQVIMGFLFKNSWNK